MSRAKNTPVLALIALGALAMALGGCGERDQIIDASAAKPDGQPWEGAQNAFVAPGYQPGDKNRWQLQLRERAQTQDESVRIR